MKNRSNNESANEEKPIEKSLSANQPFSLVQCPPPKKRELLPLTAPLQSNNLSIRNPTAVNYNLFSAGLPVPLMPPTDQRLSLNKQEQNFRVARLSIPPNKRPLVEQTAISQKEDKKKSSKSLRFAVMKTCPNSLNISNPSNTNDENDEKASLATVGPASFIIDVNNNSKQFAYYKSQNMPTRNNQSSNVNMMEEITNTSKTNCAPNPTSGSEERAKKSNKTMKANDAMTGLTYQAKPPKKTVAWKMNPEMIKAQIMQQNVLQQNSPQLIPFTQTTMQTQEQAPAMMTLDQKIMENEIKEQELKAQLKAVQQEKSVLQKLKQQIQTSGQQAQTLERQIQQNPISKQSIPIPKQQTQTPEQQTQITIPKQQIHTPEQQTQVLKQSISIPKQQTQTPEQQTQTPEQQTQIPIPKQQTQTPKQQIQTPEQQTPIPKQQTKIPIPEHQTQTPKQQIQTPEQQTPIPDQQIQIPEPRMHRAQHLMNPNTNPEMILFAKNSNPKGSSSKQQKEEEGKMTKDKNKGINSKKVEKIKKDATLNTNMKGSVRKAVLKIPSDISLSQKVEQFSGNAALTKEETPSSSDETRRNAEKSITACQVKISDDIPNLIRKKDENEDSIEQSRAIVGDEEDEMISLVKKICAE